MVDLEGWGGVRVAVSVCLFVCVCVCTIEKHPILGVVETLGQKKVILLLAWDNTRAWSQHFLSELLIY